VVLIAGTSSGMGRGVALPLAAEGTTIVAAARRETELRRLANAIADHGGACVTIPPMRWTRHRPRQSSQRRSRGSTG
jgi:NADP-dependent 3-hydroxy acid dehydrogenase YdfG